MKRYGTLQGITASDDAKKSLSSQTAALIENYEGNKIGEQSIYVEASRIKRDLLQYDAWGDSSWTPVSMGGHYSYAEILGKLNPIITLLQPKYEKSAVTQKVVAAPVSPPIAAPGSRITLEPAPTPAATESNNTVILAIGGGVLLLGVIFLLRR